MFKRMCHHDEIELTTGEFGRPRFGSARKNRDRRFCGLVSGDRIRINTDHLKPTLLKALQIPSVATSEVTNRACCWQERGKFYGIEQLRTVHPPGEFDQDLIEKRRFGAITPMIPKAALLWMVPIAFATVEQFRVYSR